MQVEAWGLGFRAQGAGFSVQVEAWGLGLRVQGAGLSVQGLAPVRCVLSSARRPGQGLQVYVWVVGLASRV